MPADLKKPFNPSCCDGGASGPNEMSAQPCGCDPGAKWQCARHKAEWRENETLYGTGPSPDQLEGGETATSSPKRYSTFLEVKLPDGNRVSCELRLTLTGSFDTNLDWFWTQVLDSLERTYRITDKGAVPGSLLSSQADELGI